MGNNGIDTTFDGQWQKPVWVQVGSGIPDAIKGPRQALTCLRVRWPAVRGAGFSDAKARCAEALRKKTPCEAARAAFVRAAQEARMLVS